MQSGETGPGHPLNESFGMSDLDDSEPGRVLDGPDDDEGGDESGDLANGHDRFPRSAPDDVPTASLADQIREREARA